MLIHYCCVIRFRKLYDMYYKVTIKCQLNTKKGMPVESPKQQI